MSAITLAQAEAWDAEDPLACFRGRFHLPEGVIYLDGNSLGALPLATSERQRALIEREWGESLVRGWNDHDWIDAPARIGAKIARVIGVDSGSVVACDSTSVNLFKLVIAAARIAHGRRVILTEPGNFPTDLHVTEAAAELLGMTLRTAPADAIADAIDGDTALVVLTHVHYKTGARLDMAGLNAVARARGTRILWDLSHSAGAIPLSLAADGAELAVGCGYKYLNGGPGAPAFLHVAPALQGALRSPIAGWMGHAAPFAFRDDYAPANGVRRFLAGTPPMLSMIALETGIDLFLEADIAAIAAKSGRLFDIFASAGEAAGLALVSPRDAARRGSHASFAHAHAHGIVQAMIARGVIGDFRELDIARFGFAPLYLSHTQVWRAGEHLRAVMEAREYARDRFQRRARVT